MEQQARDAEWFDNYKQLALFPLVDFFDDDQQKRNIQRDAFIQGDIPCPVFEYPRIDSSEWSARKKKIFQLQQAIQSQEGDTVVKEAYLLAINDAVKAIDLLLVTAHGDMDAFVNTTVDLYGKPTVEAWSQSLGRVQEWLTHHQHELQEALPEVYARATAYLKKYSREPKSISVKKSAEILTAPIAQEYTDAISGIHLEENKMYGPNDIAQFIQNIFTNLEYSDWKAQVDQSSKVSMNVDHEQKVVNVPQLIDANANRVRQIMIHEIFTHIARRENAATSPLKLLSLGLNGYYPAEEGIAMIREQGVHFTEFSIMKAMLLHGIALGLGMHAGKVSSFRDVYEEVLPFMQLRAVLEGADDVVYRGQRQAWTICVRLFRGTDCKTPGAVFTKDYVYAQSFFDMVSFAEENEDEVARINSGKYNPLNKQHCAWLDELGITA